MAYLLRGIDPRLWRRAKQKAARQGETMRSVLLRLLQQFVRGSA